jgi:hypothetical protein
MIDLETTRKSESETLEMIRRQLDEAPVDSALDPFFEPGHLLVVADSVS